MIIYRRINCLFIGSYSHEENSWSFNSHIIWYIKPFILSQNNNSITFLIIVILRQSFSTISRKYNKNYPRYINITFNRITVKPYFHLLLFTTTVSHQILLIPSGSHIRKLTFTLYVPQFQFSKQKWKKNRPLKSSLKY